MEDKVLDLVTKMYNDMQGMKSDMQGMKSDMQEMKSDMQEMKSDIHSINKRLTKVEIIQEDMTSKIDTIIEVQDNHMQMNENNHKEMFEVLSGRINITENVVRNITVVK